MDQNLLKARTNFPPPKQSQSSDVLAAPGISASPSDYYGILERTKIDFEDMYKGQSHSENDNPSQLPL